MKPICGKNGCTIVLSRDYDADSGWCPNHGPIIIRKPLPEPPVREGRMATRKYTPPEPPEATDPAAMRAEMIAAKQRHKGPQPEIYPNRAELRVLPTRARGRIL